MIKNIVGIIAILFVLIQNLQSQKEDYIWGFGYNYEHDTFVYGLQGGIELNFNVSPPDTDFVRRANDFSRTNASICDENGDLLFYTNGVYIGDRRYQIMQNGKGLNKWSTSGYRSQQGALILPFPSKSNQYMVFYGTDELFKTREGPVRGGNIVTQYAIVDMSRNGGFGSVIKKNLVISSDTLKIGTFTACRHANGRDWWIPLIHLEDPWIDVYLLSPKGLNFDHRDTISFAFQPSGTGAACFSPDGTIYYHGEVYSIYEGHYLDFFDFDRCSGHFSNQVQFFERDTMGDFGLAISPNSRYAYVMIDRNVFQYDLWAQNIENSKDTVATYDGHIDVTVSNFGMSALGPDGKIYITPLSTNRYLHVIHAPDSAGVACRVEQRAIMLPAYSHGTMPNFPHFRLGVLEGSDCDTIVSTITNKITNEDITIYPNPTKGILTINKRKYHMEFLDYTILNLQGEIIKRGNSNGTIDVCDLVPGLYLIHLSSKHNGSFLKKFFKI